MGTPVLERFKRMAALPSPPGKVTKILALCQDEDASMVDLIDTVASDPALSLRLLKYANSSLVGSTKPVTSIQEAVLRLGVRSVRLMALSFSLVAARQEQHCQGFDYGRFWYHSLTCGVAARHLARRTSHVSPEEAFTAGLLAHVGKMVFATCCPSEYAEILNACGGVTGPTASLEEQYFKTSHPQISADLMAEWGIPERLVRVVRFHQRPADLDGDAQLQRFARIVGTASSIADIIAWAQSEKALNQHSEVLAGNEFFKDADAVKAAIDAVRQEASELVSVMSLDNGVASDAAALNREAAHARRDLSLATELRVAALKGRRGEASDPACCKPIPGLADRAALEEELARRWRESAPDRLSITLLLIDVDHFGQIAKDHGDQAGQAILQRVADVLRRHMRSVDFIARYSSSTFAVILSRLDHLIAARICVRIRRSVETLGAEAGGAPPVTVSIGAVLWEPTGQATSSEVMLQAAEHQLARSQAKGHNCCSMRRCGAAAKRNGAGPGGQPQAGKPALAGRPMRD